MTWNKPGDDKQDQTPWGDSGNQSKQKNELDKFVKQLKSYFQQLNRQLGPRKGRSPKSSWGKFKRRLASNLYYIAALIVVVFLLLDGVTIVKNGQQAVVLTWGKFNRVLNAGVHWTTPVMDKVIMVPQATLNTAIYEGSVLTKDDGLLSFVINVQYRIANPSDYLFATTQPEKRLEDAVASSVNQLLGQQPAAKLLTEDKKSLEQQLKSIIVNKLAQIPDGFALSDVSLQALSVPEQVKDAYENTEKAKKDRKIIIQQANDDAKQLSAQTKAQNGKVLTQAQAYQQEVVLKAKGETARYLALLPEYQKNPKMTRARLYTQTMQELLGKLDKVIVDVNPKNAVVVNLSFPSTEQSDALKNISIETQTGTKKLSSGVDDNSASQSNNSLASYGNQKTTAY